MDRYESLNALRGLGAIAIVAAHLLSTLDNYTYPSNFIFSKLIPISSDIVFLFMLLSAFSMCCGYYHKFKAKQIDLNQFYKRRYSRVLPFFAVLIAIDFVVNPSVSEIYEAFANLTLLFGLLPNADIHVVGVGWFLGLIFIFYMIFPFFVFLIDNKKRAWFALLITLALHYLATSYFSRPELVVKSVDKFNIVYCLPAFVMGGILFLYKDELKRWTRCKSVVLVAAVFATVLFFATDQITFLAKTTLFSIWIVYAIVDSNSILLSNKFMNYIGSISMEIYLCHMAIYRLIEKMGAVSIIDSAILNYVTVLLMTVLGSVLFSHIVKFIFFPKTALFIDKYLRKSPAK